MKPASRHSLCIAFALACGGLFLVNAPAGFGATGQKALSSEDLIAIAEPVFEGFRAEVGKLDLSVALCDPQWLKAHQKGKAAQAEKRNDQREYSWVAVLNLPPQREEEVNGIFLKTVTYDRKDRQISKQEDSWARAFDDWRVGSLEPGEFRFFADAELVDLSYRRPAFVGMRIGHDEYPSGSITALVERDSRRYALTAAHLYPPMREWTEEDWPEMLQPGPGPAAGESCLKNSRHANSIGKLELSLPLSDIPHECNTVDAAIARTDDEGDCLKPKTSGNGYGQIASTIAQYDKIVGDLLNKASVGVFVQKHGQATGKRWGRLVCVDVEYSANGLRFSRQFLIEDLDGEDRFNDVLDKRKKDFADDGDSGALVVDEDNKPIGLLMARSDTEPGYSLVNPINEVLCCLEVDIATGGVAAKRQSDCKCRHRERCKSGK